MVSKGAKARFALVKLFDSDLVRSAESPFLQDRCSVLTDAFADNEQLKDMVDLTIASNNLGVFLASVGNSIQAIFWTLVNLMKDQAAYTACQETVLNVTNWRKSGHGSPYKN